MKTTKNMAKKATVLVTSASLMLLVIGTMTAFAGTTLQENEAVWGKPLAVQLLDNGAEKRFYKLQDTGAIGYNYSVYKDGQVIDRGLAVTIPETKKVEKEGIAFSSLSKEFYQSHPATAQDVESAWGKPVAVRPLGDGLQEKYFKYQNTAYDLGYRVFLEKDNQVIASALARVTGVWEKMPEFKGVPARYVSGADSKTIAEVENTWGNPVRVTKLSNGTEERYYRYGNTMLTDLKGMFLFKDGKLIASAIAN